MNSINFNKHVYENQIFHCGHSASGALRGMFVGFRRRRRARRRFGRSLRLRSGRFGECDRGGRRLRRLHLYGHRRRRTLCDAAASERLLRLLFDAGRLQGRGRPVDGTAAVLPEDQEIAAAVRFHPYPSGRGDEIPHAGHRRPAGDHHGAGLPFRDGDRRRHQLLRGGPDGRTAHLCDHAGRHRGQQMGTLSRYGQGDGAEQDVGSRLPDDRQPRPRVSAGDRPLGAA